MSQKAQLTVKGKKLAVSNLDKVLYPKVGFTKGQVIDYYIRIAPVLLPHLRDRPLTLVVIVLVTWEFFRDAGRAGYPLRVAVGALRVFHPPGWAMPW